MYSDEQLKEIEEGRLREENFLNELSKVFDNELIILPEQRTESMILESNIHNNTVEKIKADILHYAEYVYAALCSPKFTINYKPELAEPFILAIRATLRTAVNCHGIKRAAEIEAKKVIEKYTGRK